jgi:hypothetical protein
MSVRRSVHMELDSRLTDFHEIVYLGIFRKSLEQLQDSFQPDMNNRQYI